MPGKTIEGAEPRRATGGELPSVAIIGRPNVGKSSLFNLFVGRRLSIVHEESGVTRDRLVSTASHKGKHFQVIDTGGLGGGFADPKKKKPVLDRLKSNTREFFEGLISEQVAIAVESSDFLLLVVDVTAGPTQLDRDVASLMRHSGKPSFLVINKVDNPALEEELDVFCELGLEQVYPLSCLHKSGFKTLLSDLTALMPNTRMPNEPRLQITVAGRPNVGKSSLVNKLLGDERSMVSDIAGTTRDAIDSPFELKLAEETIPATLVDTAGLRKRGKADSAVEIFSVMRAETAIKRSKIVLLVIDARDQAATAQDAKIGKIIAEEGKGCVIVANKWDECKGLSQNTLTEEIRSSMPFLSYAPIVFTCALSGFNMGKVLEEIAEVYQQYLLKIPTSAVNKALSKAMERNAPHSVQQSFFKIYYATMTHNEPPTFILFVNKPALCPQNYKAYLVNALRAAFGFRGLPIRLTLRARKGEDVQQRLGRRAAAAAAGEAEEEEDGSDKPARR